MLGSGIKRIRMDMGMRRAWRMMRSIEIKVGELLLKRGLVLATAESCTGGLIGQRVTDVSGSSGYYAGGIIAYSNAVKVELLGVGEDILEEYGAVSAPVAEVMAVGVMERLGADIAVSTTGIAGPLGGSEEKPIGLVYIGLALRGGVTISQKCHFEGNRSKVRMAASQEAFEMIQHYLSK